MLAQQQHYDILVYADLNKSANFLYKVYLTQNYVHVINSI